MQKTDTAKFQQGMTLSMADEEPKGYKSDFKDKALALADEIIYNELKRQSNILMNNPPVTLLDIQCMFLDAINYRNDIIETINNNL